MNIYEVRNELGLRKRKDYKSSGKPWYKGVLSTGDFKSIDDYGVGLLTVKISPPIEFSDPIIVISTIDDGAWRGFTDSKVDIEDLATKFTKDFGIILPTERQLNNFLSKYNIYGYPL